MHFPVTWFALIYLSGDFTLYNLSIILPAYNEEDSLDWVLKDLRQALSGLSCEYEIIVVDDGSSDNTAAIAREHPQVVLLQHQANRGYGAALKTGIRHARHELVCITDADCTYPNEAILDLIETYQQGNYDMVVGARTGQEVAIPLIRQPAKWLIGKLANLVANYDIPDLNSGLRLFKRSVALRFFKLLPDGFSFTTTLTLGMLTNGYLVGFIPIDYKARVGKSKIRPFRDTLNFIQLILRIAILFAPLKFFIPLSAFLLAVATAWGLFSWYVLKQLADVSTIVIAMAALQIAVVGLLAELINQRMPNIYRDRQNDNDTP